LTSHARKKIRFYKALILSLSFYLIHEFYSKEEKMILNRTCLQNVKAAQDPIQIPIGTMTDAIAVVKR
jgi:hypothetical protein